MPIRGPATNSTSGTETSHLAFYEAHQISPVRYQAASIDEHLERRDSLYRSLGLPPIVFKGARVLEVAAGSGQNSLYVASCLPLSLDLVEPNPTGRAQIESAYRDFGRPHTAPVVHARRLQEFEPADPFDIVIVENWLGSQPSELDLIRKLAGLVSAGGVLVLTITPVSGLFPNIMRKLMALRILPRQSTFEEKVEMLTGAFGPHLATMASMTRSHRDWVIDCLINPHYLNIILPLDVVLDTIGRDLEVLATFPRFMSDWRWFKSLTGEARQFSARTLDAYRANVHNFVDYRKCLPPLEHGTAALVDDAFRNFHRAALSYQEHLTADAADSAGIYQALEQLSAIARRHVHCFEPELDELMALWSKPAMKPEDIRDMKFFGSLFGRETIYVSFARQHLS